MSGTERPEQEPKEHDTKLDRDARFIAPAPCGQKVLGGQEGLRQANRLGQESREGMDQGMDAAAILRRWQLPLCRPDRSDHIERRRGDTGQIQNGFR